MQRLPLLAEKINGPVSKEGRAQPVTPLGPETNLQSSS